MVRKSIVSVALVALYPSLLLFVAYAQTPAKQIAKAASVTAAKGKADAAKAKAVELRALAVKAIEEADAAEQASREADADLAVSRAELALAEAQAKAVAVRSGQPSPPTVAVEPAKDKGAKDGAAEQFLDKLKDEEKKPKSSDDK